MNFLSQSRHRAVSPRHEGLRVGPGPTGRGSASPSDAPGARRAVTSRLFTVQRIGAVIVGATLVAVRARLMSGLLVLVFLFSACSAAGGVSSDASTGGVTAGGGGPDSAGAALAFQGRTLDGAELDAAALAGSPVVLWFWAPWCTICRAEAPDVSAVADEFSGRVEVIGVAGRGEVAAMRDFVADTGTGDLRHVVDQDGELWTRFGVISQPAFVFVSATGATESFAGSLGREQLRSAVDELDRG